MTAVETDTEISIEDFTAEAAAWLAANAEPKVADDGPPKGWGDGEFQRGDFPQPRT